MDSQVSGTAILPMLVTGIPHDLRWNGGTITLREPAENERLIAGVGDNFGDAEMLFPGKRLVPIKLNPADLLPGPPLAWESLDAILLEASFYDRVSDAQRSAFLAGGVALISIGDRAPDARWPWRKSGALWMLSLPIAGPGNDLVNENIYTPTFGWTPGLSGSTRAQVMGVGTLLILLMIGSMLLPRPVAAGSIVTLSLIATIGIVTWRHSLGSVDHIGGDVLVAGDGLIQRDVYVYEREKGSSVQTIPFAGWTHPVFASSTALSHPHMKLTMSSNGDLAFTYQATSGHTMAFLRREVQPGATPPVLPGHDSPMREVVKLEYLNGAGRITGEVPGLPGRWNGVLLERQINVRAPSASLRTP